MRRNQCANKNEFHVEDMHVESYFFVAFYCIRLILNACYQTAYVTCMKFEVQEICQDLRLIVHYNEFLWALTDQGCWVTETSIIHLHAMHIRACCPGFQKGPMCCAFCVALTIKSSCLFDTWSSWEIPFGTLTDKHEALNTMHLKIILKPKIPGVGTYSKSIRILKGIYFYFSDMKFECLATWRDGSDTFIYGGFSGSGVLSRDHSYRCFVS